MRKLILVVAVLMVAALFAFVVMPAMSPDVGVAVASENSPAGVMELAVMNGEVLAIDSAIPVSASTAEMSMWLALGAILLTITVAYGRRLANFFDVKNMSLRRLSDSTDEGAFSGGGPNKFILPAAA